MKFPQISSTFSISTHSKKYIVYYVSFTLFCFHFYCLSYTCNWAKCEFFFNLFFLLARIILYVNTLFFMQKNHSRVHNYNVGTIFLPLILITYATFCVDFVFFFQISFNTIRTGEFYSPQIRKVVSYSNYPLNTHVTFFWFLHYFKLNISLCLCFALLQMDFINLYQ